MTELARRAFIALLSLFALAAQPALAEIKYFYDEAGRLIQVVDHSGESAQYVYDAAGNITKIIRVSAGTVSVAGFTPNSGPVAATVTIYGAGFSSTPASNTVRFNGTAASVSTASANQLVATVPAGATTGTISVTVGAQTATSAESFTVTSGAGAPPTITGFSPGGGPAGTAVTITGTNFDTVLINNTLRFNVSQAAVTSASATQIVANVPMLAGSGPLSVRTLYGTAQSADDFVIPPAGYLYADIIARTRLVIDGASGSLAVGTNNKHGMLLFDAAAGDYPSVHLSSLTISPSGPIAYKIFDTTNTQIAAGNISASAASIHIPRVTRAGTHSIVFSSGSATVSLTAALKRSAVLSATQPTMSAPTTAAGQSVRGVFTGTAGQALTLRLAVASASPSNANVNLYLFQPSGALVAQRTGSQSTDGTVLYSASLPATGTYAVLVEPQAPATGTMSVTLNPAMDIAVDGASVSVGSSAGWNSKRVLFAGTAGQGISAGLTALAFTPANGNPASIQILQPDGNVWAAQNNNCWTSNPGGNCPVVQNGSLPVTGTYSVLISPPSAVSSFSGTLTLSTHVTGTLSAGTPNTLNFTRPGQMAVLAFSGTAGQQVALRLGVSSTTPTNQNVVMYLYRSNGTYITEVTGAPSTDGALMFVASLPATDTYSAIVIPRYSSTGSMSVTLNPTSDLTIDGTPAAISTTTAGYTKRFIINATAGQRLGIGIKNNTHTPL
jgi:YD repeat-containing protein